jgi:hypothetical protein
MKSRMWIGVMLLVTSVLVCSPLVVPGSATAGAPTELVIADSQSGANFRPTGRSS